MKFFELYLDNCTNIKALYLKVVGLMIKVIEGVDFYLARAALPNACETKIICTMNLRILINFCHHRYCRRAQDEIHNLAWEMVREVEKISPLLDKCLGASCQFGPCPEGDMCCGKPFEKKVI